MSQSSPKQPREVPGGLPVPLVGTVVDTVDFLLGWTRFFDKRRERYQSTVFNTSVPPHAISIVDLRGFRVMFDTELIAKMPSIGPIVPWAELIGNIHPTLTLNGEQHAQQKRFLGGWIHDALPRLIGTFARMAGPRFERWAKEPTPFDWGASADDLLCDLTFEFLLGAHPYPADARLWFQETLSVLPEILRFRTSPTALAARDRLLSVIRTAPHFERAKEMGHAVAGLDEIEIAYQILFWIAFQSLPPLGGLWRSLVAELSLRPALADRVRDEIERTVGPVDADLSQVDLRQLQSLPTLRGFIFETLRLHPPAPFSWGKATRDFVLTSGTGQYRVRKGQVVQGVFVAALRDPSVFEDPDRFDPDRYADPRVVEGLIWAGGLGDEPPGPQNRTCAGNAIAVMMMQLFCVMLLPRWQWTLRDRPTWGFGTIIPTNPPKEKLLVTSFTERRPRPSGSS